MTKDEVMAFLKETGSDQTKKVLTKHGAQEPFYGVKVGDLKKLVKKIKKDHALSLELYDTGNSDAMYLAGLIADETRITKEQLQHWVEKAYWYMLSDYTVAWVASESSHADELAAEWIKSDQEFIASAGWSTYSSILSIRDNIDIDLSLMKKLLKKVETEIHSAQNRVRYAMNGFVIAAGSFVPALTAESKRVAQAIGKVDVQMGGTACKVPLATDYIAKVESMNRIGTKKKTARC